jgi:hypothetical protein
MTNIYYEDEESLGHKDGTKTINSLFWKYLYKRVEKRLSNSIINIDNMKKIVFNKHIISHCKIKAELPYVFLKREPSWYYADDEREYFLPFGICFSDGKRKYHIVLIDGKIDLRDDSKKGESLNNKLSHSPVLLIKNFKKIENSFEVLLEYIKNKDENKPVK